jgi:hypothetical protein
MKDVDVSGLPELITKEMAAERLHKTVRSIWNDVDAGRLIAKGYGKAGRITKESFLALVTKQSAPKVKLTIPEKRIKRTKQRADHEADFIYDCAIEFMAGARAGAPAPKTFKEKLAALPPEERYEVQKAEAAREAAKFDVEHPWRPGIANVPVRICPKECHCVRCYDATAEADDGNGLVPEWFMKHPHVQARIKQVKDNPLRGSKPQ